MGSSLIKQIRHLLRSQQYQWSIKATSPLSITLQDRRSGIIGDKYAIDYSLLEQEWPLYILRRNSPRYLVAVYDVVQEKEDSLCATSKEVAVVIQQVPYRLSDLGTLSFQEGLYVLKCVLEGYRALISNGVAFYLLDETAVCFTRSGQCKFWINQNLQLARPHPNRIISEPAFIAALLQIVELRITNIPNQYIQKKEANGVLTLQAAMGLVDRFKQAQVQCMASLMGMMGSISSPHSTKYPHSANKMPPPVADQKVSISKFRRTHRRRTKEETVNLFGKHRETPRKDDSQPKKLSLSFSRSQRNDLQVRLAELRCEQLLFVSLTRKQSAITPSLIVSDNSSRENSYLRLKCLLPSNKSMSHI